MADSLLQTLLARAQKPLMSDATKTARMQTVDPGPSLDRSPMEARLRGFGAGMQEGLSDLTSPLNLASNLSLGIPGMGLVKTAGTVGKLAGGAARGLAGVIPEVVQVGRAAKQVMPEADDVTRLAAQLKNRLTQVPTSASKMPSMPGEFTHMGNVRPNPNLRAIAEQGTQNVGLSPMRRTLQSQTGEVNPNLILGGGAALGGGLLAKKLYDALQGMTNPFRQASDVLDKAGQ